MRAHQPGGWITPAMLGIVAGTALQLQQPELWRYPGYALLALAGTALVFSLSLWERARGPQEASPLGVQMGVRALPTLTAFTLIAFAACGVRSIVQSSDALTPALEGRDLTVTGLIAAMPQRTDTGPRFRLQVEEAFDHDRPVAIPPQLALGWYAGVVSDGTAVIDVQRQPGELRAGERWRFTVRLKAPHGTANPLGFDYELWLWEQGIQATGYVRAGRGDPPPVRLDSTWRFPVERARQAVRDSVFEHVADRRIAGVLAALVAGDQNAIERSDWDVYRATGVAHLMSISGLHITMFAWAAGGLMRALWRRSERLCLAWPAQHAALVGGVLLAGGYALFSGWGVPAQRTVTMLATVTLLRLAGRRWPWPQVWLLACAVVVTADPHAMLQAGFWLSFVAVGVLFATDPGASRRSESTRLQRLKAEARAALHEQWVVTLALTPLTLLLFGQVSIVGLAANAFAIPWVTVVVTPLAMVGAVVHPLWAAAGIAVQVLDAWLRALAALPFASVFLPTAPAWAGAIGVAGGLLLAMRLPGAVRLLGVPLLVPVLLWQVPRPATGVFEVLAADIGQGNAVLVRTATHALLYDTGPRYGPESDAGHRVLVPLLRALGEHVDVVMLSHRDSDHAGGAQAVLAMQPDALLRSSIEDTHPLQLLRHSERCIAGQHWNWDGVDFDVLHPRAADYATGAKSNALSCVLRIAAGGHAALLVGDIEQPQEARLVADGVQVHADLLLVPHHGSKTSSSAAFLDAVRPGFALVQAGYRNRFGHPAAPVMDRYAQQGIAVIASTRCGAARWRSDDPARVACQREIEPHYWSHRVP
jgi:competence protein ComEC